MDVGIVASGPVGVKAQAHKVVCGKYADAARAKWAELDGDGNCLLEQSEIRQLATWVWESFRPGRRITESEIDTEAAKILKRCDKDKNGAIDFDEFLVYFATTAEAMHRFSAARQKKLEDAVARERSEFHHQAAAKWASLDKDRSGWLEGDEILELAAWSWSSIRPGQQLIWEEQYLEAGKILRFCDENRDGIISELEFHDYYHEAGSAMQEAKEKNSKRLAGLPAVTELMKAKRTAERLIKYAKSRRVPTHSYEYLLHNTDAQERMWQHVHSQAQPIMAVVTNHAHDFVASSPRWQQPYEDLHEQNRLFYPVPYMYPASRTTTSLRDRANAYAEYRENNHIMDWEHACSTPHNHRYTSESSEYRQRMLHLH